MSSSRVVDVGTPSNDFSGWTTTELRFHDYADLTTTRGEYEASPEFSSLGHEWRLVICPGGSERSAEGMVAANLVNMSDKSIKVEHGFSVKDAAGKEVLYEKPDKVSLQLLVAEATTPAVMMILQNGLN